MAGETGCDAVIHTAALHGGNRETHTPRQFTEVNVLGLQGMLELAVKLGVRRFVFSSTMEVVIGRTWDSSVASIPGPRRCLHTRRRNRGG